MAIRLSFAITILIVFAALFFLQYGENNHDHEQHADSDIQLKSGFTQSKVETSTTAATRDNFDKNMTEKHDAGDSASTEHRSSFSEETEVDSLPYWITDAGLHEVEEFRRSQGHGLILENSDINSYDIKTLKELAHSNEIQVLHALALKYLSIGEGTKAFNTYKTAAIHGSTEAIERMASFYAEEYYLNTSATSEEKKAFAHAALGFYHAAVLRGNHEALSTAKAFIGVNDIQLSESDHLHIADIANSIYSELELNREKLGLEPFDNSVPEAVKDYYSTFSNSAAD